MSATPAPHEEWKRHATEVVRRLSDAGHRALWAGGCVRDQLLGRVPKDYDVATSATPQEVMALFEHTVPVGVAFGVVVVLGARTSPDQAAPNVEVATFRADEGYSDGRHPDRVRFCGEEEDVRRRDFTINGLLFDPLKNEVLDYVDGENDLKQGLIRAIGDPAARFKEDRLRMLRAVRFASTLAFKIDLATRAAIQSHAAAIHEVSMERIREELAKILTGPHPRTGFEDLDQTGLLAHILPEVAAMKGVAQPPEFHPEGDVWIHTLLMLGALSRAPLPLAWGVLLHDVGKPPTFTDGPDRIRFSNHENVGADMAESILRRLRCPNELIEQVQTLVKNHMNFRNVKQMRDATLKKFLRLPQFEQHLELHRIDCASSNRLFDAYEFCLEKLEEYPEEILAPEPLIKGRDLIELGLQPGAQFKTILEAVEERQLEGALTSRDEALDYVRKHFMA